MSCEREAKDCPFCGEQILTSARKCKHCGEWLDHRSEAADRGSSVAIDRAVREIGKLGKGLKGEEAHAKAEAVWLCCCACLGIFVGAAGGTWVGVTFQSATWGWIVGLTIFVVAVKGIGRYSKEWAEYSSSNGGGAPS